MSVSKVVALLGSSAPGLGFLLLLGLAALPPAWELVALYKVGTLSWGCRLSYGVASSALLDKEVKVGSSSPSRLLFLCSPSLCSVFRYRPVFSLKKSGRLSPFGILSINQTKGAPPMKLCQCPQTMGAPVVRARHFVTMVRVPARPHKTRKENNFKWIKTISR